MPTLDSLIPHFISLALAASICTAAHADGAADSMYKTPPAAIVAALNAPPLPGISINPSRTHMVLMNRISLPPLVDLARPMLRLAGSRIDPGNNGPHGPRRITGFTVKDVASGIERPITLPDDADLSSPIWSPSGDLFAFTLSRDTSIELWIANPHDATAKKLADGLNAAAGSPIDWMPDGKRLLVRFIPADRPQMPVAPPAPAGPVMQETAGTRAQVRTYQDLLQNAHDERLYTWVMQTQLAYIDTTHATRTDVGPIANYSSVDASPDGNYLLISRVLPPFSYLVPSDLFPEVTEVWNAKDGSITKVIQKTPLREDIPIQGVEKGPRAARWQDTQPATLIWAEALDEGNPKNKVPHRDRLMVLAAPFSGPPTEWLKTEHRFTSLSWLDDRPQNAQKQAMVSEFDRDRRWTRTWLVNSTDSTSPRLVFDRSTQDQYNNPGSPLTTRLPSGRRVVRVEADPATAGTKVYLAGQGASPDGDRPFLDAMSLQNFATTRLWRNTGDEYESVIDLLTTDTALTAAETATAVPNYFIRNISSGDRKPLTAFVDPVPELRRVKKELVTYKRADGVTLSATLYLPADYQPGTRLPMLVWAYPQEFNDASTAGQVSGTSRRFTSIGGISHLFLLTQGYAVMDNATMPVIGDPETVNDTFVAQITQAAQAAIDFAVSRGVADPDKVAVGGHSYGAFMTANLLAHSDFFRAGIARSGAYNRTLTPFGFQGERRTYWEAVDTYTRMSPFTFAHQIKAPLLLTHGQIDSNPGTFPVQSERLYAAIKGNGGTARLVVLPFEDHGYAAKESVFHVQAEMVAWLDTHVKNAKPRPPAASSTPTTPSMPAAAPANPQKP